MGEDEKRYKLGRLEIFFIVLVMICLIIAGSYAWVIGKDKISEINSFEACVAAGNPVMETYPEQCSANGQTFTNPLQKATTNDVNSEGSNDTLDIPEFEVRFNLISGLSNVYYYISPENPTIAYFSLNEFKGSECSAEATSLAALGKHSQAEVDSDEMLSQAKDQMIIIDDNYFLAEGAQATCSDNDAVATKAGEARGLIIQSINSSLKKID